jgi:hypothetical protein
MARSNRRNHLIRMARSIMTVNLGSAIVCLGNSNLKGAMAALDDCARTVSVLQDAGTVEDKHLLERYSDTVSAVHSVADAQEPEERTEFVYTAAEVDKLCETAWKNGYEHGARMARQKLKAPRTAAN